VRCNSARSVTGQIQIQCFTSLVKVLIIFRCIFNFTLPRLTAGGPGVLQKPKISQILLRLTDPTCEVWASIGEPKSGRSGASECERNEARAPTGFQGAKRGSSRPGEFHPQSLSEPYLTVSRHTALHTLPLAYHPRSQ